ncbi:MAG: hypothetical protein PHH06_03525 [Candidatus Gracilibacteria bacterium]|nr:hypothetical protein [Candidatus Gracilibacteria bacterium]
MQTTRGIGFSQESMLWSTKNIVSYFPIKRINISILGFFDKLLKIIFLPKTLKHYDRLGRPYGVILNDDLLKFHDNDIRKQIKNELLK